MLPPPFFLFYPMTLHWWQERPSKHPPLLSGNTREKLSFAFKVAVVMVGHTYNHSNQALLLNWMDSVNFCLFNICFPSTFQLDPPLSENGLCGWISSAYTYYVLFTAYALFFFTQRNKNKVTHSSIVEILIYIFALKIISGCMAFVMRIPWLHWFVLLGLHCTVPVVTILCYMTMI